MGNNRIEKKYDFKNLSQIKSFEKNKNEINFNVENAILKFAFYNKSLFKIIISTQTNSFDDHSFAVINKPSFDAFSISDNSDCIMIKTSDLEITLNKKSINIKIVYKNQIICEDKNLGFLLSKDFIRIEKKINENDAFYGLGEKTGFLDKRGREYMMWNTDELLHLPDKDPMYKSIPFLIVKSENSAYGIFSDSSGKQIFNLGYDNNESYYIDVYDSFNSFYFIFNDSIKNIITDYSSLTGRMELPPVWALGYQQCRWSYFPEAEVMTLAKNFREKEIPCDVIYLDIDYMDGYRVFTWDNDRFPDPKKMIENLSEMGFKIVTIVDPGVKIDPEYEFFKQGIKADLYCKFIDGSYYKGKVWPGDVYFPDFTKEKTKEWWAEGHKKLFDSGVSGIWNDMNEPANSLGHTDATLNTIPNDVLLDSNGNPKPFAKLHNIYGLEMAKAAYIAFAKQKPNERPFILTRSAYSGIQRYASVWTGDNISWWEHLAGAMPMLLNIGLSGIPFCGCDVGGFASNASPELFARWIAFGTFMPLFRGHSCAGTKDHEPWSFGDDVLKIARKFINLRYELMPYIYSCFYKASTTGLAIMRPLLLDYENDPKTQNLCDQFLFGENILVAPIYRPSTFKRLVYLPKGNWFNYWTDECFSGQAEIIADAPLDSIPLFIKAGSIIPMQEKQNHFNEKELSEMVINIYPGNGDFLLYEDDGISNEYKFEKYSLTNFSINTKENTLCLNISLIKTNYSSKIKKYILRFHGMKKENIKIQTASEFLLNNKSQYFEIILNNKNMNQTINCEW